MTATGVARTRRATRPPLWRDVRVLRVIAQVVAVAAVVAVVAYLYDNVRANYDNLGIDLSFDYLDQPAGVQIAYSDFRPSQPVRDAVLVGVKNTALVAGVGIALALLLGTVVGIARLSSNWLLRLAATAYVEALRNLPPLLVIIFVNAAVVLNGLPRIDQSFSVLGVLELNNRQLAIAAPIAGSNAAAWGVTVAVAIAAAVAVWSWRTRRAEATGAASRRALWAGGLLAVVVVGSYLLLDGPVTVSRPEVVGRRLSGGAAMSTGYAALTAGLVLYTASHIAEIVRGSIQAVSIGQAEAADALGLSTMQRLRFVVLPQAFRIAVPPTINQFLNLTKNSSLAIFVAYSEITLITTQVIGNGNPAVQSILLLMAIYLTFSVTIAFVANQANRRLQLVER